ncbi:TonB-dependent receptor [Sphingomonas sp. SM33]|uniref:TonB-dependent receptor n=1 Tax=Sphingomonas telluris TaxID=2907998 RepID=A0ABS9VK66_9SPHN|nr:TonB-dependent receptor [Sphingomonas telluris]MCH8615361.1 TonB-dependent receptor [Sphingomonas telluris]
MIDAVPPTEIVVTAERAPENAADTPASVSVIDGQQVELLGDPLVSSVLRLTPSVSVATSGPAGSLTEVRIRGAENNHTLLFIDGIRANDPATGNQPRYELLNADLASRIEVVRGPQSALWGSEAVGGVIAIDGVQAPDTGGDGTAELGSFGFRRASTSGALANDRTNLAAAVGWQRADGINAVNGPGDKDGYRNLSGRARGTWNAAPGLQLGVAGFALSGRSDFDGFDDFGRHDDTLDNSRNRLLAGRVWGEYGSRQSDWHARLGVSLLESRNRNFLDEDEINLTSGRRATVDAQVEHVFQTGKLHHRLILAFDHESEDFKASDTIYGGATNQDRDRKHQAGTLEWRTDAGPVVTDLALRRDWFNRFEDATTVRASVLAKVGGGFSIAASYGEGIAQPTFFDLYGFFPNSFVGNPSLKPESSRGFEGSVRFRKGAFGTSLTAYRQRLRDEIVDVFDPATFLSSTINRSEKSNRSGIEAAADWTLGSELRLSANYAYLKATERSDLRSNVREARRPKHSGSVTADGQVGHVLYGASIAYTGERADTDFEVFPFQRVKLGAYWLAGARIAYEVHPGVQLFARAANAFDAKYQDALGYRTEGRSLYAGIRLGSRS